MAIESLYDLTGSADCTSSTPEITVADCPQRWNIVKSQITDIFVTDRDGTDPNVPAAMPSDVTDLAAWTSVLGTTDNIRRMKVVAGLPASTTAEIDLGAHGTFISNRTFALAAVNSNVDATNEASLRLFQRGWTGFMWFATSGKRITSVPILCQITQAEEVYGNGNEDNVSQELTFSWDRIQLPPMADSPF